MSSPGTPRIHDEQTWSWSRRCRGAAKGPWCGKQATVVCTERRELARIAERALDSTAVLGTAPEQLGPLQWYACDDPAHQEGGVPLALGQWEEQLAQWHAEQQRDRRQLEAASVLQSGGEFEDVRRGRGRMGFG